MDSRADHFVAQARSDLRAAQSLARGGRSGQSLGTSMYLCQQSVEKAFKSVLLRLQERAGLKLGENNLRSLGHTLYHELHRLYRDNVSVIELPRLPHEYEKLMGRNVAEQAAARELEAFEKLSASWGNKEDKKIKRLAWSHSVGIRLEDDDLEDLNSFHTTALGPIYASVFGEAHRPVSLKNEKRPSALYSRILEDKFSPADHKRYVEGRNYAPMHSTLRVTYRGVSDCIAHIHEAIPDANRMQSSDIARRAMLEFGFRALALAAHPYHVLYPHSDMGRHPTKINGRFTDDVYGEQAEYVIKTVFHEGEYLVWGLCATTAHVEKLWREGAEAGLW